MSKEIRFCTIDTPPVDWGLSRKVIDREKYVDFLQDSNNAFPDNAYFCNKLLNGSEFDNQKDEIEILGRIGSPSADGEVYRIRYKNVEFALKIMPRIDNDSESKNKREIETANLAAKYSDYFPLTFAYGYCPDSSYYKNEFGETSPFIKKAIEYSTYSTLRSYYDSSFPNKNPLKRFEASYRSQGFTFLEETFKKLNLQNTQNKEKEEKNEKIQVDFLVSELANSDLGFWMTKEQPIDDWKQVLLDVFAGIYYLTVYLKKVHPDLHPGNVLIVKSKNKEINKEKEEKGEREQKRISALIHDFGRCYDIVDDVKEHWSATILSFCFEFISCSSRNDLIVPREIGSIVSTIYDIVKNKKIEISHTNLKEVYEKVIFPIIAS